jgi:hypothetical protein
LDEEGVQKQHCFGDKLLNLCHWPQLDSGECRLVRGSKMQNEGVTMQKQKCRTEKIAIRRAHLQQATLAMEAVDPDDIWGVHLL